MTANRFSRLIARDATCRNRALFFFLLTLLLAEQTYFVNPNAQQPSAYRVEIWYMHCGRARCWILTIRFM